MTDEEARLHHELALIRAAGQDARIRGATPKRFRRARAGARRHHLNIRWSKYMATRGTARG